MIQEADVRLTRVDADIIIETLKNANITASVKDMPAVLTRVTQLMQKIAASFEEPLPEEPQEG